MKKANVKSKAFIALFIVLAMIMSFIPFKVMANDSYTITFTVKEGTNHTMSLDGNHLKIDGQYVDPREANENYTVTLENNVATMTITNGMATTLNFNSRDQQNNEIFSLFANGSQINNGTNFSGASQILIDNPQPSGPEQNQGWQGDSVYFVWATEGESNNFYYHKITNVVGGGEVNYVPVSTIVADNANNVKFNINNRTRTATHDDGVTEQAQSYEFVWTEEFEALKDTQTFTSLTTTTAKMDYLRRVQVQDGERDITVNPIRALDGANCISTMGDLAFKLTIYNDAQNTYEGVKVGVPGNYEYYPSFWDGVFHWDIVDVSGTTKANPATFEAFLLERTLQLNCASYSRDIVSIKALDVPEKAVTVANAGNGKWNITYSSNYYDDVELELTDTNGQKYYIVLLRVNVRIRQKIDDESRALYAAVYYPETDSYTNYSVILTINYKNGTSETKLISSPTKGIEGENGDMQDVFEYTGGENISQAWYKLDGITAGRNSNTESFSVNVVKNYSATSTNYGGTLSGSENGIVFRDNGRGFERVIGEE